MPERPRSALVELTVQRTKEFLREPEAIFWVFAFPLLMAVALGLAFRERPPERIPVAVVEGPRAREIERALARSPALLPRVLAPDAARQALRTGKVSLALESGEPVVLRSDPTRPDARAARLEVVDALERAAGRRDLVPRTDVAMTEKGSRYIDFLIPGLVGMNLMGTGMWGVGFAIVNARTRKLLKRLLATPMRKRDYLLAQVLFRLAFVVIEVACLVGFGWVTFGVGVHGSMAALAVVAITGGLTFSGLGLLVASRARTIEAVSGLMNVVMLPMWLLSGTFFSSERFPEAIQPAIRALPLTALNDGLRLVMNEGRPLAAAVPQLAVMAAWGILSFAVALKIFRWS